MRQGGTCMYVLCGELHGGWGTDFDKSGTLYCDERLDRTRTVMWDNWGLEI